MKLHFLGANQQVTGSCYLLEVGDRRILIDCGLYQERCCLERNWNSFSVNPETIDRVLLTHAHLDHCGLLPRLHQRGYRREIHCTRPTEDLARIVLEDSAAIQEEDVRTKRLRHEREGRTGPHPLVPLYTRDDVESTVALMRGADYLKPIHLDQNLQVRFHDAGHILGSAMVEVIIENPACSTNIVFSGDIGRWDSPLVENPAIIPAADYVVMESTYGDREHEDDGGIEERLALLVEQVIERKGNLIIPTFAIDRAQDLLYYFSRLANDRRMPRIGVYLDSPMAVDVTSLYKEYAYLLDKETRALLERGEHPFQFSGLHFVRSPEESRRLMSSPGPNIILAGSGMCTGGRIKHHLRHNIERQQSTVLFVGYQAADTLGHQIVNGAREVRIHGQQFKVRAQVERLDGLSAHADRQELMRWLGYYRDPPKRLFLTHGEAKASESLAQHVRERLGWEVTVPAYLEAIDIV